MIILFSKRICDLILIWVCILTAEPNVYNLRAKLIALHVLATILPEYRSDDLSVIKKVRVTPFSCDITNWQRWWFQFESEFISNLVHLFFTILTLNIISKLH